MMESIRSNVEEVLPCIECLEEEVSFIDNAMEPLPENIRSGKIGQVEHAVMEQM
jgi:hypothetical protein